MELTHTFTQIFQRYSQAFKTTTHQALSVHDLVRQLPANKGVYVIHIQGVIRPIYIGSAGKINRNMTEGNSTVKSRLRYSSTPYHFDHVDDCLSYGPTTASVPPEGYSFSSPVAEIEIKVIQTPTGIAPSALEHMLIQGFINEYRDLPLINQKI